MKKLLALLIVLVLTLSVFAEREWYVDNYVKGGKKGGSLILATSAEPKTFNPYQANDSSSTTMIGWFTDTLMNTNLDGLVREPALAKAFSKKDLSNGGVEYTFTIRNGVKWSDGTPFTLDDVLFTFQEICLKEEFQIQGNDGMKDDQEALPVISKVDNDTLKIVYKGKFRRGYETWGSTTILPKHLFGKYAGKPEEFAKVWTIEQVDKLVGNGPFLLKEYKPGVRLVFERNPDYYAKSADGVQLPYLDKLIYLKVSDTNAARLKFEAGETDLMSPSPTDYPSLKAMAAAKNWKTIVGPANAGSEFIAFNWESSDKLLRGLFRDVNFRKAVATSLNRTAIIDNLYNGLGISIYSDIPPSAPYFSKAAEKYGEKEYKYSVAKAKDFLNEVKGGSFKNGKFLFNGKPVEFTMITPAGQAIREEIANMFVDGMKKFGIKVNLRPLTWSVFVQKLTQGDYDATVVGFTGGTDPGNGANIWRINGPLHLWNLNPETSEFVKGKDYKVVDFEKRMDEIYVEQIGATEDTKLRKLWDEFQMILAQNQPLVYTITSRYLLIHKNSVHYPNPNPGPFVTSTWHIWGMWKD